MHMESLSSLALGHSFMHSLTLRIPMLVESGCELCPAQQQNVTVLAAEILTCTLQSAHALF